MEFLEELLGMNLDAPMRAAIAFGAVLILILVVAWIFRRLTRGGLVGTKRGRVARLAILEAIAVDQKRRLILLRRDNTEHLVMIGGGADLVIEQGIHRAAQAAGVRPAERKEPAMRPGVRAPRGEPAPAAARAPEPKADAKPDPKFEPQATAKPQPKFEPKLEPAPQQPARPTAAAKPASPPPPPPQPKQQAGGDEQPAEAQLSKMADRLKAALKDPAAKPGAGNGRQTEQVREPDTTGR